MQVHPIWEPYPELHFELGKTHELIQKKIRLRNKAIESALLDMTRSGGKLLRPAYTLLFSTFGSEHDPERARSFAAAIELLHTATLIHDDIVDDAPSRRGQVTIQSKYGKDVAVYAGDYLFTACFQLISQYAKGMDILDINTRGMERILMGELDQMYLRYNLDMTIRQYLTQISGKTAQLFSLSCYTGALEGGQSDRFARHCYYIGSHIGMAYQIVDDILDYSQTAADFGKPVLEDVRQGVYSSPLIYALQKDSKNLMPLLEKGAEMTADDTKEVQRLVIETGGLDAAKELAEKYTKKALKRINQLPDQTEKMIIRDITMQLLSRKI